MTSPNRKKKLKRKKENHVLLVDIPNQSRVPCREEESRRMKHLVDISAKLRDNITDPLNAILDTSESGDDEKASGEMDDDESESDDSFNLNSLPKPLKFPRLKHRNRDSMKLQPRSSNQKAMKQKDRTPWLDYETDNLKMGVKTYGVGKWSRILQHYDFLPCRTSISLKDKWRNLVKWETKFGALTDDQQWC